MMIFDTDEGQGKKKEDSDDAAIWSHTTLEEEQTYRIANFLGRRVRTGIRVKHTTKRAIAARFRAPKTSKRSQRLTEMSSQRCSQTKAGKLKKRRNSGMVT
jgi:hypothetical protein